MTNVEGNLKSTLERWEETVQHELLRRYFVGKPGVTCYAEFEIPISKFQRDAVRESFVKADFVVDYEGSDLHYEVIECKASNHPMDMATALGQAATYRALMEEQDCFPRGRKAVRLGLCFVDGYRAKSSTWTTAHDKLLDKLSSFFGDRVFLYLAHPTSPEYASGEHWFKLERQAVDLRRRTE
jgi:hypothetical protein